MRFAMWPGRSRHGVTVQWFRREQSRVDFIFSSLSLKIEKGGYFCKLIASSRLILFCLLSVLILCNMHPHIIRWINHFLMVSFDMCALYDEPTDEKKIPRFYESYSEKSYSDNFLMMIIFSIRTALPSTHNPLHLSVDFMENLVFRKRWSVVTVDIFLNHCGSFC